jgi:hypothetical protein
VSPRRATALCGGSAAALVGLLALAGCGGDGDSGAATTSVPAGSEAPLTRAERKVVGGSTQTIERYCADIALAEAGRREPPSPAEQTRTFAAVKKVVEVVRKKPKAQFETGVDGELFLSDLAEDVEGASCDPRVVERIDTALAAIPTG